MKNSKPSAGCHGLPYDPQQRQLSEQGAKKTQLKNRAFVSRHLIIKLQCPIKGNPIKPPSY